METSQTNIQTTPEAPKSDAEILAAARKTAREVGAVAERAVYVLDQSGAVLTPQELADARARRAQDILA